MDITLLDQDFAVAGDPVDRFSSLVYTDAWDDHGSFSLEIDKALYSRFDGVRYVCFDNRTFIVETKKCKKVATISGRSLSALFDGIAIYDKSVRVQGNLEVQTRALVSAYAMSGSQAIPKLVLGTLAGFLSAMDATAGMQSLSDFLFSALPLRGFSFNLVYDQAADEVQFNVIYGANHQQAWPGDGTVVFSTEEGNIENPNVLLDEQDYYNFAYVNNENEDDPQIVEVDLSGSENIKALAVSGKKATKSSTAAENMYVMVGSYTSGVGYIATSTDGTTWTDRVTSGYGAFWAVDYQNGMFIVCGSNGVILTSEDGITWTSQTSGVSVALEGALYYDGLWIATGNSSAILTSYNATSWSERFSGTQKVVAPTRVSDRFVAIGSNSWLYTSRDGSEWIPSRLEQDTTITIHTQNITETNGVAVAAGYILRSSVRTPCSIASGDGFESWSITELAALTGYRFLDVASGNGVTVAVGQPNIIMYSADYGATWTDCTPSATGTPDWITITFDGERFHAYSAYTKHHAYSSDGITWTVESISLSAWGVDAVIYGTSSYSGNLYQIGVEALQKATKAESVSAEILPGKTPVYGTDYEIGSIVDIVIPDCDIMTTKRVTKVKHVIEPEEISVTPIFGDDVLNLRKFIKREVSQNGN